MVVQAPPTPKPGPNGPNRPSPVSSIDKIASLKRYENRDYALELLHDVAKAVGPLMHHYNFKVGMLCEMYPKNPQLLGLNVNHGQKILIRLRPPYSENSFYPMSDLIGTMLHELTHNVHGPHDAKFYALLEELTTKYEAGAFAGNYVCEENKLGSGYVAPWQEAKTIRQKRLEALSKGKYKAELRKLGGTKVLPAQMREAMLRAVEQRIKDSKWCHLDVDESELVKESDLTENVGTKAQEYQEVIDLTEEEPKEGDKDEHVEVIEVDACEQNPSWEAKLQPALVDDSTFGTGNFTSGLLSSGILPSESGCFGSNDRSLSPVYYRLSSSPGKTFIGDELQYPRRKMVADLNFDHIIQKNLEIRENQGMATEVESTAVQSTVPAESKEFLGIGKVEKSGTDSESNVISTDKKSKEKSSIPEADSHPVQSKSPEPKPKRTHKIKREKPAAQKKKKPKSTTQLTPPRSKEVRAVSFEELLQGQL